MINISSVINSWTSTCPFFVLYRIDCAIKYVLFLVSSHHMHMLCYAVLILICVTEVTLKFFAIMQNVALFWNITFCMVEIST